MGQVSVQTFWTSSGVIVNSISCFLALVLARSQAVFAGLACLVCFACVETQVTQREEPTLKYFRGSSWEHLEQCLNSCSSISGLSSRSNHSGFRVLGVLDILLIGFSV